MSQSNCGEYTPVPVNGWTCQSCGVFVPCNEFHVCNKPWYGNNSIGNIVWTPPKKKTRKTIEKYNGDGILIEKVVITEEELYNETY